MIVLTRLDNSKVLVALENIKFIETTPDTLVRFINGDLLLVLEKFDEIYLKVESFKIKCLAGARQINVAEASEFGGQTSWT